MKETKVREIRNSKHHLVGKYNPERRTIQIERKGMSPSSGSCRMGRLRSST